MTSDVLEPQCIGDFAEPARERLPADVWDFIQGGSGDELTLAANRAAFDSVHIFPRMLRDVSTVSTVTKWFGADVSMPVAVAPMAYQRLIHSDGELAAARAAGAVGIPFTVCTLSSVPLEDIARCGAVTWFQLYWLRDRGLCAELVSRAGRAGCQALVVTVDVPRLGRRLRDERNGFTLPLGVVAANLADRSGTGHEQRPGASAFKAHTDAIFDASLTWSDLAWVRERTDLPLILKGILDPRDAATAVSLGVEAIVVSNHGGRQLDGAIPSIVALDAVREVVGDSCAVFLDSGIRGGTDALKALAAGSDGVLLGRPVLWGLAVAGEHGVHEVLRMLRDELVDALTLAGCAGVADAGRLRLHGLPRCGVQKARHTGR